MPRTPEPARGSFDPAQGLRALADLINDALRAMGTQPIPALAPAGPSVLHTAANPPQPARMAIDLEPAKPTVSRARRASADSGNTATPAPPGLDDEDGTSSDDIVDEEHVETWRLVRLAQDGDGEAFGQLYDRYVDTVFRFVYFRVNDRALAEDFTSETFLRALRRISTISYQGRDIGAWFITIARNIVLDHMKSARHRLEITTSDTLEGNDREPSTEEAVLGSLASEHLMAAVRKLGDEQRECVMLRFIQGFSVSETAAVMGKNDGAIKALQHRAVRKLAEMVSGDFR